MFSGSLSTTVEILRAYITPTTTSLFSISTTVEILRAYITICLVNEYCTSTTVEILRAYITSFTAFLKVSIYNSRNFKGLYYSAFMSGTEGSSTTVEILRAYITLTLYV